MAAKTAVLLRLGLGGLRCRTSASGAACAWKAARWPCSRNSASIRFDRTAACRWKWKPCVENLHPWSERACVLELKITPPDGGAAIERRYPLDAFPGRTPIRDVIEVPNPKLWWPNGMGEQPLYRVSAQVVDQAGTVYDRRQFSIGLRTIEIDRTHVPEGSRFCVRVNGQDVFCHGGNLGPQDAILARITDAKYEKLVAEAKNANVNMFRINGCSIYEGPAFYDACDRAGILIFHDFMLTDTTYPNDDKFNAAVVAETESVVRHVAASSEHCALEREQRVFHGFSRLVESRQKQAAGCRRLEALQPILARPVPASRSAAALYTRQSRRRRRRQQRDVGRLPLVGTRLHERRHEPPHSASSVRRVPFSIRQRVRDHRPLPSGFDPRVSGAR